MTMEEDAKKYITEATILLPLASVNSSLLRMSCEASNNQGRGESPVHTVRVVGEMIHWVSVFCIR